MFKRTALGPRAAYSPPWFRLSHFKLSNDRCLQHGLKSLSQQFQKFQKVSGKTNINVASYMFLVFTRNYSFNNVVTVTFKTFNG